MDRQTLARRIQFLLLKTTERGCTEAEAHSAAVKAAELLELYQMSRSDLELEADGCIRQQYSGDDFKRYKLPTPALAHLLWGVGRFCECRSWTDNNGRWGGSFFGLRSDVEFAVWLFDALATYTQRSGETYTLFEPKRVVTEFLIGCAERIRQRLYSEAEKRKTKSASTGRDLVVSKSNIRDKEFAKLGIRLGRGVARSGKGEGYAAGVKAGDRAGFGKPVGSASNPRISYSGGK